MRTEGRLLIRVLKIRKRLRGLLTSLLNQGIFRKVTQFYFGTNEKRSMGCMASLTVYGQGHISFMKWLVLTPSTSADWMERS
jgi:hypothetical protein